MKLLFTAGALLAIAAPCLFSAGPAQLDPKVTRGRLEWWTLSEAPVDIKKRLGPPSQVSEFGDEFLSWQYRLPGVDHEADASLQLVLRRSGQLVSVTRSYEEDRDVRALFPARESSIHSFPDDKAPQFRACTRRLGEGRILIASGLASGAGLRTSQLVVIREKDIEIFFPWLAGKLPPQHSPENTIKTKD
jgi:hypothetical protein